MSALAKVLGNWMVVANDVGSVQKVVWSRTKKEEGWEHF